MASLFKTADMVMASLKMKTHSQILNTGWLKPQNSFSLIAWEVRNLSLNSNFACGIKFQDGHYAITYKKKSFYFKSNQILTRFGRNVHKSKAKICSEPDFWFRPSFQNGRHKIFSYTGTKVLFHSDHCQIWKTCTPEG